MKHPCRLCGFQHGGAEPDHRYCTDCERRIGNTISRTIPSPEVGGVTREGSVPVEGTSAGSVWKAGAPVAPASSSFMEVQAARAVRGLARLDRTRRRLERVLKAS